jgi:nicotinamide mononucleotide transporter
VQWQEIYTQFVTGLRQTTWLEFVAVVFGIASVLFSRKENILVYPTGIVNTVLYTWFCFGWWDLYAEGSLNFYYTGMSLYGWYVWAQKTNGDERLHITPNSRKDWAISIGFFLLVWAVLFFVLQRYTKSTVPWGDSFASATAYTGMWQMARKKIENWMWWTLTNLASVPLYFSKGAVFTSFQYIVFLILAIMGWIEWRKKYEAASA